MQAIENQQPARLGTAHGKRVRKKAKQTQGFELNPPRCVNCQHLRAPKWGLPALNGKAQHPYVAMACGLGNFQVLAHSICDKWEGKDGETLAG